MTTGSAGLTFAPGATMAMIMSLFRLPTTSPVSPLEASRPATLDDGSMISVTLLQCSATSVHVARPGRPPETTGCVRLDALRCDPTSMVIDHSKFEGLCPITVALISRSPQLPLDIHQVAELLVLGQPPTCARTAVVPEALHLVLQAAVLGLERADVGEAG